MQIGADWIPAAKSKIPRREIIASQRFWTESAVGLLVRGSGFVAIQVLTQLCAFATGLVVIWMLPKSEYALYTFSFTFQLILKTLADTGLTDGVLALAGRKPADVFHCGAVLLVSRRMRRYTWPIAFVIALLICGFSAASLGATPTAAIIIVAGVVVSTICDWHSNTLGALCLLKIGHRPMQRTALGVAVFRLAITVVAVKLVAFAQSVTIANASASALSALFVSRMAAPHWRESVENSDHIFASLRRIVLQQAPNSVFTCVHGQIVILLMAVIASNTAVADYGALSRFGSGFAILGAMLSMVVQPKFASQHDPRMLRKLLIKTLAGFSFACGGVSMLAFLWPTPFTFVLGPQYSHLSSLVALYLVVTSLAFLKSVMWGLTVSKGWTSGIWMLVPLTLFTEIATLPLFGVSSLRGAILWSSTSNVTGFIFLLVHLHRSITDVSTEQLPA